MSLALSWRSSEGRVDPRVGSAGDPGEFSQEQTPAAVRVSAIDGWAGSATAGRLGVDSSIETGAGLQQQATVDGGQVPVDFIAEQPEATAPPGASSNPASAARASRASCRWWRVSRVIGRSGAKGPLTSVDYSIVFFILG
jgi:hypothetical protein